MIFELMDEYHWTEAEIKSTRYQQIQEIFLLRRVKGEALQHKMNIEKFKSEHSSRSHGRGGGQGKRFIREL